MFIEVYNQNVLFDDRFFGACYRLPNSHDLTITHFPFSCPALWSHQNVTKLVVY